MLVFNSNSSRHVLATRTHKLPNIFHRTYVHVFFFFLRQKNSEVVFQKYLLTNNRNKVGTSHMNRTTTVFEGKEDKATCPFRALLPFWRPRSQICVPYLQFESGAHAMSSSSRPCNVLAVTCSQSK